MGSQHSTPARRTGQGTPIRARPLSRLFRARGSGPDDVVDHDDDAQSVRGPASPTDPAATATQETQEALAPAPHACPPPGQDHMGGRQSLVRDHGLVRAHDPHDQQAPAQPQAEAQAAQEGAPTTDRARCQVVAAASPPAREAAAPAATESPAPSAPVPILPVPLASPLDPVSAGHGTTDGLDALWSQTPASATASTAPAPSVAAELPPLELPELDQQRPVLVPPTLSSRSASTFNTAPSTPTTTPSPTARIPRTLPLGTTMIVQGLVQTIEVPRPAPPPFSSPSRTTPASPTETSDNVMPSEPIRQSRPSEHAKPSNPPIAGGDAPETRVSTPEASTASSSSSASPNTTPTMTPPDTPPTDVSSAPSNTALPASSSTPDQARPSIQPQSTATRTASPPPSSTDVLGLLLSIAAQATAESLVPWSVPPRSRNLNASPTSGSGGQNGIATGLAAAFSALAAGGAGTRTNPTTTAGTPTESTVAVETSLPPPPSIDPTTIPPPAPAPVPVAMPRPRPNPTPRPSSFSRRFSSTFSPPRRTSVISNRRASTIEGGVRNGEAPRRRAMSMLGETVRRFMPWRSGAERVESGAEVRRGENGGGGGSRGGEEVADFARAPPTSPTAPRVESADIPVRSETPVVSSPTSATVPSPLGAPPTIPPPPVPVSDLPPPDPSARPRRARSPPSSSAPRTHPTTDAEDLVRFSHMLGFTPGAVHPAGSFERFLADMQDELRAALGEYQERTRVRSPERRRRGRGERRSRSGDAGRRVSVEGGARRSVDGGRRASGEGGTRRSAEGRRMSAEGGIREDGEGEAAGASAERLDYTRPHVPSTDPLPLNWWRMYRFPALPDVTVPASGSPASTITVGSSSPESSPTTAPSTPSPATAPSNTSSTTTPGTPSPSATPEPGSDAEPPVPVHPAIIIGLRSVSRDPLDEAAAAATAAAAGTVPSTTTPGTRRSTESRRYSAGADTELRRSSIRDRDATWARSLGLPDREREEGESEERRSRDGTRNYIIWIIGGYYPSNHPLLAHPNLFLGQVHPDELWMLNEFLGQVKPPTASREDIAKAGLRVIKGAQLGEFAKDGGVTENCTERCLICLDDYADEEDLRIMSCKHMFHKDCVDRWMETGRNNCPACRTKGVDTTSAASTSAPTAQV
ncbi:hypothetical protein FRC12_003622 [Ceratobasidium sp. 428]|nr:hypothetical protein FRC12_003622 [Ceratobasidium sp. 428]